MPDNDGGPEGNVIVLRCSRCGDTFPATEGGNRRCPSCGSTAVDLAGEPLL